MHPTILSRLVTGSRPAVHSVPVKDHDVPESTCGGGDISSWGRVVLNLVRFVDLRVVRQAHFRTSNFFCKLL
jgi:hypothetical protein